MLTIFEELVSVAICSRSNLRSIYLIEMMTLKSVYAVKYAFQLKERSL